MIKKEKKEKKENEKNKKEYFDDDSSLSYIKIDNLNKIEGLKEDAENQILMDLVNSMTVDGEDNIGKELNNFFCLVLPENNKEGDVLKTNYALSKKIRNNCGLKKNKNKMKIQHEEFMTQIMNIKINQNFILTREMNEKLCFVLAYIFKIIKKNKKFNNIEELIEYILQQSKKFMNLLDKYKDKDYNRNDMTLSSFIYNNNPSNNIFNNGENINQDNKNLGSLYSSRISQITQFNNNDFNRSTFIDYYINNTYKFREIKTKKPINVPLDADDYPDDLSRASETLDRLSPERAKTYKRYISTLKKNLIRRAEAAERRNKALEEEVNLVGQRYIDMEYPNVDDVPVCLSAVVNNPANRYVVLDFWATWCLPCVKSIPMLKEVYAKYHDKGLEIYSISQDSKAKEWKSYVEENGMNWINVLAGSGSKVYKDYGIEFIPRVFLIDCQTGEILVHESQPDLDSILSDLLP